MLDAQSAYGPDRRDQLSVGDIAVGRCLYRTLPEDRHDRQPLTGAGGRFTLVADVRIDNRPELLRALGDTGRLGQAADSDILLAAFERWGLALLDRVVGDFAFALWDREESRLVLARDPVGERPLYYHQGKDFFAFASVPKGLHALRELERRPNYDKLTEFVGLIPEMGRGSHFEGIEQVSPGHIVAVTPDGLRRIRYWNPERRVLKLPRFEDYRDAFREQLDRAVTARLRGGGSTVASHLSAGWDSSSVTATAARLLRHTGEIEAFTAVPEGGATVPAPPGRIPDEGPIAAMTAAMHPNVRHTLLSEAGRSPIADLDLYVERFDRPVYNLCNFTWLTTLRDRAAENGHRVMLTGELGNFTVSSAPYTILADLIRDGRWGDWWREARSVAARRDARWRGIAASSFGPWVPGPLWSVFRPLSSRPETEAYTAIAPGLAREVEARREAMGIGLASRSKDYFSRTVRALGFYDNGLYRKGALAGWGLDERDPTGDRRLIEFCLSLPLEMLLKDGVRRPLARAALSDRLPREVLDEKRKGYQASEWYKGLTQALPSVRALIDRIGASGEASSLIDVEKLRGLVRDWPSGGWERPEIIARYRGALLGGLSAGHFILSTSSARRT
jgi:asparagine synthase (glutamine-hydrolysing)